MTSDRPNPLRSVVIAGGTGLVGRHLTASLAQAGTAVTVVSRNPGSAVLPAGAQARGWDELPGILERTDALVNLCGLGIAEGRWTLGRKELLVASRVEPTQRLVEALATLSEPPKVLVNASAVGIYGPRDGRPITEADEPGQGFLAHTCRRWEAAADAALGLQVRVAHLRLGVVLAKEGGALPRMARPVRWFQGARLGHGQQGLSWIHVEDAVGLIQAVLAEPGFQGPVNATSPMPVSNETFTRALARRLRRPMLPVPAWMTRTGIRLLFGEMGEELLLWGAFVYPRKAERLGFVFQYPRLEDALANLLPR